MIVYHYLIIIMEQEDQQSRSIEEMNEQEEQSSHKNDYSVITGGNERLESISRVESISGLQLNLDLDMYKENAKRYNYNNYD